MDDLSSQYNTGNTSQAREVVSLISKQVLEWETILEQATLQGVTGGSGSRRDIEFAIEGGGVMIYGAGTNHQVHGNLYIGPALCQQAQYLHLTCSQAVRVGWS